MKIKRKQGVRNWINQGVCGLLPIYHGDGGNYTKLIFYNNSPIIVQKKVCTILGEFARFFQKDIRLIRQQAREITGKRSINPLPFTPNIVLVPFKTRKPIGKDDGAMGYFLNNSIDDVEEEEEEVKLVLKDGNRYRILETFFTAKHHIGYAHQVYYHMIRHSVDIEESCDYCRECAGIYNTEYNQPATKGDLIPLTKNIGKLADLLNRLQG